MIVLAMHGILTSRAAVTWPERFEAFASAAAPEIRVLVDQYDAGPFPRFNCWEFNPRMARAQAARIIEWLTVETKPIVLIGHSNGCDIIRDVAGYLAAAGVKVNTMILVAPPISPRMDRNGLGELVTEGKVGKVICYGTPGDTVLAPALSWRNPLTWFGAIARYPYGNMGRVGITGAPVVNGFDAPPAGCNVFSRMFPGFWHTTYFEDAECMKIFNLFLTDVRIPQ